MQMRQVRFSGAGGKRLGIFGFDFDMPAIPDFSMPGAPAPAAPAAPAPAAPAAVPEAGPSMSPAFLFPTTVQQAPQQPAPAPAPTQEAPAAPGMSTETILLGAGAILGVVALAAILS